MHFACVAAKDPKKPLKSRLRVSLTPGLFTMAKNLHQPAEFADDRILEVADQYRKATNLVYGNLSDHNCVFPLFTVATFAIELYLKALNSRNEETPGPGGDSFWITSKPNTFGHNLESLFGNLHASFRAGLEQTFQKSKWARNAKSLKDALLIYKTSFEDSRYPFEAKALDHNRSISGKSADGLVALVELIGDYAHSVARQ